MTEKTDISPGVTWVVVAHTSRADIYTRAEGHSSLEVVQSFTDEEARSKEQDLVADEPGRTFDSAGQEHTEEERLLIEFARYITDMLGSARRAGRFKSLVIVAAPVMLGKLRAQLDTRTAACVIAEFNEEITGDEPEVIARLVDIQS
ncbi:MAG: host attachment protein [Gammaproteobacteria bacterium]|jgi:protein required for attachment to host cells|nr:host attachment protein [Gammaproteobacteria bacterium]MDP6616800.1 host attachment protein [Gammaproteobacteria bacterium]MDP6696014.1 host attachment protein [Gammaproteobacteria bacterium]MDP7042043.1 host attachment protein [Gammaproteobacteria bacterium]